MNKFVPSKSHKKLSKKIETFLQCGKIPSTVLPDDHMDTEEPHQSTKSNSELKLKSEDEWQVKIREIIAEGLQKAQLPSHISESLRKLESSSTPDWIKVQKATGQKTKLADYFSPIAMVIIGQFKRDNPKEVPPKPKEISDVIVQSLTLAEPLRVEVSSNGFLNFFTRDQSLQTPSEKEEKEERKDKEEKKEKKEKKGKEEKVKSKEEKKGNPFSKDLHRIEVTTVPSSFIQEEYDIFYKYQRTIHKEPPSKVSESGYTSNTCSISSSLDFLVDSPLEVSNNTL